MGLFNNLFSSPKVKLNLELTNHSIPWQKIHYASIKIFDKLVPAGESLSKTSNTSIGEIQMQILMAYIKIVYSISHESAGEYLKKVISKMSSNDNYQLIARIFGSLQPKLDEGETYLLAKTFFDKELIENGFNIQINYVIAEVIEDQYGKDERERYIHSFILDL